MYDRQTGEYFAATPEDTSVKFLYNTIIGRIILKVIILTFISKILGWFNGTKLSRHKIAGFANNHQIKVADISNFNTFNEFFTRKEAFKLNLHEKDMISVAQSKLSLYNIDENSKFEIKNQSYDLQQLLQDEQLAYKFQGGTCLIFRLCVDNYHRYCYFDSGTVDMSKYIKGHLHTVRPIAYERFQPLIENTRNYSILNTDNFGLSVFVEVGAIMVGKFTNNNKREFAKADERGYFELGGSTVVVLIEKDKLQLDSDLVPLINTGVEVAVEYGEKIGKAL
ncbi:phosphatidylserine decarboxylase [Mollicutes bacterium LVI A0039]|nr:phosphatidylserine decarboxylase [Mollicutes bacterium LVI A0039]